MSPANSCALLLLFSLTLSLHITLSTAANTIGLSRRTLAVAEKYWYSRLPNTPLPKALECLLQPGHYPSINREFANGNVGSVDTRRKYRSGYSSNQQKEPTNSALPDSTVFDGNIGSVDARRKYRSGYSSNQQREPIDARRKYRSGYNSNQQKENIKSALPDSTILDGNMGSVDARRKYRSGYSSIQHKKPMKSALPDTTIFYLYNDLHLGKKMTLLFTNGGTKVSFLPRQVSDSIPFSSDKIPEILKYLALEFNSKEAQVIRDEIRGCEEPNMEGEDKYCATSLESLIDFGVERLGQNIRVLSTEPGKKQEYTVSAEVKMIGGQKAAVCHKMRYPYAAYYCHVIAATEVYEVPLVDADGTKVKAVTVCHLNTSTWSPDHMAFEVLKIKPGPAVCHFLASDTLIWVPTKDQKKTP